MPTDCANDVFPGRLVLGWWMGTETITYVATDNYLPRRSFQSVEKNVRLRIALMGSQCKLLDWSLLIRSHFFWDEIYERMERSACIVNFIEVPSNWMKLKLTPNCLIERSSRCQWLCRRSDREVGYKRYHVAVQRSGRSCHVSSFLLFSHSESLPLKTMSQHKDLIDPAL